MDPDIIFGYEGKVYSVGYEAYDKNRIVLPDGRVLEAGGWLESLPPQPTGLYEVPMLTAGMTPQEIAQLYNGVVAEVTELED